MCVFDIPRDRICVEIVVYYSHHFILLVKQIYITKHVERYNIKQFSGILILYILTKGEIEVIEGIRYFFSSNLISSFNLLFCLFVCCMSVVLFVCLFLSLFCLSLSQSVCLSIDQSFYLLIFLIILLIVQCICLLACLFVQHNSDLELRSFAVPIIKK